MWIDTHCHLDAPEFAADYEGVAARARAVGVTTLIIPAVTADTFAAVDHCAATVPGAYPAYGLHPLYLDRAGPDDLLRLEQQLAASRQGPRPAVAVGEIGLDGYIPAWADPAAREHQERFFVAQLELARQFNLPVLLHVRRAVDTVLKHLRRHPVPGGIAHAFNGSQQQAEQFIQLGFKLGFGGTLTYSGSTRIRHLAATLPLDALVLETDAPDIPPAFAPQGPNLPEYLPRYGAVLAELRGIGVEEVAAATSRNGRGVFGDKSG